MATSKPHGYWSPSRRYIRWNLVLARATALPGDWFLAFPAAPVSIADTVRRRRPLALKHPAPRLQVEIRNTYTDAAGTRRGDLYLRTKE